jgi:hypothetical protein
LDPAAQLNTKSELTVKTLLSPLSREDIKVVRCLGLNYSDHAAEAKMAKPSCVWPSTFLCCRVAERPQFPYPVLQAHHIVDWA